MPNNFDMRNLVILYMPCSKLKEVWKGTKYPTKLKELNLSYSEHLTCTPDFTGLLNLEKLILIGCKSLVEVHENIDRLKKLVWLDLSGCHSLKNLPSSLSKLPSLKILDISYWQEIGKLPMGMRKLISSNGLCFLKEVILKGCNLIDNDIPDEFWLFYYLKSLNLGKNYFESLPSSIGQLSQLQNLDVRDCKRLKLLPMLPSSLHSLDASFCFKLERLPNLSKLKQLTMLHLSCCEKLTEMRA
ncbi:disease resistance protein RUN1-like [Macadamia integrifolia]|uniref:disease resistance protein RUN1-like n=1 Tax=Macadamia integrifolia TaxID=60698 RepID=UPI001C4F7216|nr:disease resistance protein RUN1-like [Macadamia integrifolia]